MGRHSVASSRIRDDQMAKNGGSQFTRGEGSVTSNIWALLVKAGASAHNDTETTERNHSKQSVWQGVLQLVGSKHCREKREPAVWRRLDHFGIWQQSCYKKKNRKAVSRHRLQKSRNVISVVAAWRQRYTRPALGIRVRGAAAWE